MKFCAIFDRPFQKQNQKNHIYLNQFKVYCLSIGTTAKKIECEIMEKTAFDCLIRVLMYNISKICDFHRFMVPTKNELREMIQITWTRISISKDILEMPWSSLIPTRMIFHKKSAYS